MKYALLLLTIAAIGVLLACWRLFDTSTFLMAALALGIVGTFGVLPVLFSVLTRRAEQRRAGPHVDSDDTEVIRFEPEGAGVEPAPDVAKSTPREHGTSPDS